MKRLLWLSALVFAFSSAVGADERTVLEIEVRGMVCAFCVEGLRKNLSELPGVDDVAVSLKLNRARIEVAEGYELDLEVLKRTIVDAGFTPGDVQRPE